jgi:putative ABC transport system permease protein
VIWVPARRCDEIVPAMILPFALALRNLRRNPRRTQIALAAIAFGVAAFAVAAGFIDWILLNFREYTIHSFLGHVQISRPADASGTVTNAFDGLLPEQPALQAWIRSVPHVVDVAPRLDFQGLVSNGEASLSFLGTGVDPDRETELSRKLSIVEGSGLSTADGNGAILGEGLAQSLGVRPGGTLILLANTAQGNVNAVEIKVRGIFTSVTKAYDDAALRVPIPLARRLLRVQGSHVWVVVLDRTEDTDRAVTAIRARLPADDYEVRPWYSMADFYNKTVTFYHRQLDIVRTIIAIIILISISNTMAMSIIERTSEIGTALALGTRRGRLLGNILVEALTLGLIGGVLGVLVGCVIAVATSFVGIPMPPSPGTRHGFAAGILVTWPLAAEAVALAVVPTIIATLYPAWKATRLRIVDALRYNR